MNIEQVYVNRDREKTIATNLVFIDTISIERITVITQYLFELILGHFYVIKYCVISFHPHVCILSIS